MHCVHSGKVPFILPRAPPSEKNDQKSIEGIATILVSYIVDHVPGSQSDFPMNTIGSDVHAATIDEKYRAKDDGGMINDMDKFGPEASTPPPINSLESQSVENGSAGDDDVSMYLTEDSSSTAPALSSIDVPFDAHVLPGHGRRFSAVLPVICVADGEQITSLLTSVLYQRRVWGIDEPVVGFVFSKTGSVGNIVLGWLDMESSDNRYLVCCS
jgi:hypothetical protein